MSERAAALLGKAFVSAFEAYKDGRDLGPLPHRAHYVEDCDGCGGPGLVRFRGFKQRILATKQHYATGADEGGPAAGHSTRPGSKRSWTTPASRYQS